MVQVHVEKNSLSRKAERSFTRAAISLSGLHVGTSYAGGVSRGVDSSTGDRNPSPLRPKMVSSSTVEVVVWSSKGSTDAPDDSRILNCCQV